MPATTAAALRARMNKAELQPLDRAIVVTCSAAIKRAISCVNPARRRRRETGTNLPRYSRPQASPGREAVVDGLQPVAVAARVGFALALLLDHLGLGLGEKRRVAELLGEFFQIGIEPADLLREPRLLLHQIDHGSDAQDQRRPPDDRVTPASRYGLDHLDPLDPG